LNLHSPCDAIPCVMTRDEYEQHKRRLEEELRAGMELLATAHRHQLRALELVWAAMGGDGVQIPPAALVPVSGIPAAPAVPAPAAEPPPLRRRAAWALFADVQDALSRVPEVFDRNDLCQALGYEPDRGSLYRTMQQMTREGLLAIEQKGSGKTPTCYRKTGAHDGHAGE